MDKSTGPPGPHHAHRTCSAVESTAMKLSAHTASADVNVRGVWTLIEVMYLVNPLCTGCEPLWFLNTRTLQSHLQLIVEYLGLEFSELSMKLGRKSVCMSLDYDDLEDWEPSQTIQWAL